MAALRVLVAVAVSAVALLGAGGAHGSWKPGGGGGGHSKAKQLAGGSTPSATVSGRRVTVSWAAAGGVPVDGYVVKRYNGSNQAQVVGAGCAGTVASLSCVESRVPAGSWTYTVTPARGNWRGAESAKSVAVTVAAAAVTLDSATVNSFPTTLTGTLSSFIDGQSVSFRLDDPQTGTILSGAITPSPVPAGGTANLSVTIPAGTANGAHAIYAIGDQGDQAQASISVQAPKVTQAAIAKAAGGEAGYIGWLKPYRVYANVSGSGSPPAGLATLTANLTALGNGASVGLTNGSFTVDGQSYSYRSAQLISGTPNPGTTSYTLTLTDNGGTATQTTHSVIVDTTAPTAIDIQTANVSGGTNGRAELGDSVTFTYSEPIDAASVLAGWNGAATPVVVRLVDASPRDLVQVWNASNSAQLPLGEVNLGRNDYINAGTIAFGAAGTASTMLRSGGAVTITLGTPGASAPTADGAGSMIWTPSATATDRAGNAASTAARTETGASDKDF